MTWLEELCNDPYLGINANYPPREVDYTHCIPFFEVPTKPFNPFETKVKINPQVKEMFDMAKRNTKVNGVSCFLEEDVKEAHKDDIAYINNKIMEGLKGTNIKYIDFCDVRAGSIQVRLFHNEIPGYACDSVDLSYEWDNIEEVIENAITAFKNFDNPKRVNGFKEFIADGEKWGWD